MQGSASFEELRSAYDQSFEQLRNEERNGERFEEAQQAYRRTRDEFAHFLIVKNVGRIMSLNGMVIRLFLRAENQQNLPARSAEGAKRAA